MKGIKKDDLSHTRLKQYQREHREVWGQALSLRVHRSLSWLARAEQEMVDGDLDAEFIFLWVAFNAAYANDVDESHRVSERESHRNFLERLVENDSEKALYHVVWELYPNAIRTLLDNQYVYGPYWRSLAAGDDEWKEGFKKAKQAANKALAATDTVYTLDIVLSRLYTLRNQLIHGGATWAGGLNRDQLRDATQIMRSLVPLILYLMMRCGHQVWGDAAYFNTEI